MSFAIYRSLTAGFLFLGSWSAAIADGLDDLRAAKPEQPLLAIKAISIHPWFGTGKKDWDLILSELMDKIIYQKPGSELILSPDASLSQFVLSALETRQQKRSSESGTKASDPSNESSPSNLSKLNAQANQLTSDLDKATSPVERTKLRRQLEKLLEKINEEQLKSPKQATKTADVMLSFLDVLASKIDGYKLKPTLLSAETSPRLGELALTPTTAIALGKRSKCIQLDNTGGGEDALQVDGISQQAEIRSLLVQRPWLVGPFVTSSSPVKLVKTDLSKGLAELEGSALYRISELIVANQVRFSGAFPAEAFQLLVEDQKAPRDLYTGCIAVVAHSGLGYQNVAAVPVPTPNGMINYFPQIIAVRLARLPSVEFE